MEVNSVLVVGSEGQLGTQLMKFFATKKCALGDLPLDYENATFTGVDVPEIDITDAETVREVLLKVKPDIVFNCAAYTNVDGCETNYEEAYAVNATGPENLANVCKELDATFLHISTDYVFPGSEKGSRVEHDGGEPASAYGRTKLEGEHRAIGEWKKTHIVRTAWLYGLYGKNFVDTMIKLSKTHDELNVVDDQFGDPTNAEDLAYQIAKIALVTNTFGIWHATCQGVCSWADLAEKTLELYGSTCKINRVTTEEYKKMNPQTANRPKYSSLRNAHLEVSIGDEMRNWEEALESFITEYKKQEAQES